MAHDSGAAAPQKGSSLAFMLRALRYRNYRLFFTGQIVSLVGTWMTSVATSWLVYRLTGSALQLGMVNFAGQVPAFLLAPFAGIFVDRWDKHRLLVVTQALSMLQSFSLAALTLTGRITIPWLLWLNVVEGFINAFDMPCRQAFVVSMIEDKADLGNAIALNSSMVNAARLLGPSIGALVIAAAGEGWCFFIDGSSFVAVLIALLLMHVRREAHVGKPRAHPMVELREGVRYAFGFAPIRMVITLLAVSSLVGVPYTVLMPVFAAKILHGGPNMLGLLMTSSGCGALLGAMWLATRKSVLGLGRVIPAAAGLFGAALCALALARTPAAAVLCLVLSGFGFMLQMAASNTILQTVVDDDKRGRVMSFFMMAFLGTAPFGSLIAGTFGDRFGVPRTLFIGGACCAAGAVWFALGYQTLREAIRPVYIRMGILPEAAEGASVASQASIPPEES
jgi:MFS family permease